MKNFYFLRNGFLLITFLFFGAWSVLGQTYQEVFKYNGSALGTGNAYAARSDSYINNSITMTISASICSNQSTGLWLGTNSTAANVNNSTLDNYTEIATALELSSSKTRVAALVFDGNLAGVSRITYSQNQGEANTQLALLYSTNNGESYTQIGDWQDLNAVITEFEFTFTPISSARYAIVINKTTTSGFVQSRVPVVTFFKNPTTETYTTTFNPGSGSVGVSSLSEDAPGAGITLPTATTCHPDWPFIGWATAAVSETTVQPTMYSGGATYYPTSNETLYAVYGKTETGAAPIEESIKTVGFETAEGFPNGTSYQGTVTSTTAIPAWEIYYGNFSGSGSNNGAYGAQMRRYASNYMGYLRTTAPLSNVSQFTYYAKTNNVNNMKLDVSYSTDGTAWIPIETEKILTTSFIKYTAILNTTTGISNVYVRFSVNGTAPSSGNYQLSIDDIEFFGIVGGAATITYNTTPVCSTLSPALVITSPGVDTAVCGTSIDISFSVTNFLLGTEGKVAYFVDGMPGGYTTSSPIRIDNLEDGANLIELALTDMDDDALTPEVTASITVTALPTYSGTDAQTICSSELPYTYGDTVFAAGTVNGDYPIVFESVSGCDSIITLSLTVNPVYNGTDAQTICRSELPYTYGDTVFAVGTVSDDYPIVFESVSGCDSIITLSLTVNPVYNGTDAQTICSSELPYTYGDTVFAAGTVSDDYPIVFESVSGCDSVITLSLTVNPVYSGTDAQTICSSELPYTYGDTVFAVGTVSDDYPIVFESVSGCDSIITLSLTVNPIYSGTDAQTICSSELPYTYGDTVFAVGTMSGDYPIVFESVFGCDSIITLSLTVNPIYSGTDAQTICSSELPYTYGDTVFAVGTMSGDYPIVFESVSGCDSIITLSLTVNQVTTTPISASICEDGSYNFFGNILTTGGLYKDTIQSSTGCDSIIHLTLSVLDTLETFLHHSICQGDTYEFYGETLTMGGIYTKAFVSQVGCDSMIVLILTVNPVYEKDTLRESICQGEVYNFYGANIDASGTYRDTLQTLNGCDSIITLLLTVNPVYETDNLNEAICEGESYFFKGQWLTTAGVYKDTLQSIHHCDSIITLRLTVNPVVTTSVYDTICANETYDFFGNILTTTGLFEDTIQASTGCDSIIRLHLLVLDIYNTVQEESICQGETYDFYGQPLTVAGEYTEVLTAQNGCDSTIMLTLTVNPIYEKDTLRESICQGDVYTFYGTDIDASGTYRDTLQTVNGCDSIITLLLIVNPVFEKDTLYVTICEGESYTFKSEEFTVSGIYQDTLQTVFGCDSIITLNLTVTPIPAYGIVLDENEACQGGNIDITLNTIPDVDYTWIYPNGTVTSLNTLALPFVSFLDTGYYRLIIEVDGCQFFDTAHVSLSETPNPNFTFTTSDFINYDFTASVDTYSDYQWDIDGNSASGASANYNFGSNADGKAVTLTVISDAGCTATSTTTLNGTINYAIECNNNIEMMLPAGECQITPAVLGLTSPKVTNLSDGSEYTEANVTSDAPAAFTRGVHRIKWIATDEWGGFIDTCIQIVVINYPACGSSDITWVLDGPRVETVTEVQSSLYAIDAENNQYGTVRLGCDCWLSENLISTLSADGTPIEGIYKYYDARMYPDSNENSNIFGLLYNWEAAVNACPAGWKLPTELQFTSINSYHADDLRTVEYWLNAGTNLTGFSALPAGMFNDLSNSFYYLMGDAYFWSTTTTITQQGKACHIFCGCPTVQMVDVNSGAGLSIRCVKE